MKANEFVKKYGFEEAKQVVRKAEEGATIYVLGNVPFYDAQASGDFVVLDELVHFVESYELVQSKGGLSEAKEYLNKKPILTWNALDGQLSQAVKDVEACNA